MRYRVRKRPQKPVVDDATTQAVDQTAGSFLRFSRFINAFSKWISLVFIAIYVFTWGICWYLYATTSTIPPEILSYVLDPTQVILGFYFGTKMFENVSKIVVGYLAKKLRVETPMMDG